MRRGREHTRASRSIDPSEASGDASVVGAATAKASAADAGGGGRPITAAHAGPERRSTTTPRAVPHRSGHATRTAPAGPGARTGGTGGGVGGERCRFVDVDAQRRSDGGRRDRPAPRARCEALASFASRDPAARLGRLVERRWPLGEGRHAVPRVDERRGDLHERSTTRQPGTGLQLGALLDLPHRVACEARDELANRGAAIEPDPRDGDVNARFLRGHDDRQHRSHGDSQRRLPPPAHMARVPGGVFPRIPQVGELKP
jgi:hypothetical protein